MLTTIVITVLVTGFLVILGLNFAKPEKNSSARSSTASPCTTRSSAARWAC